MARGFYKALNLEAGEGASVMLLIFQSIFLGIFYGTFDISASAMFLEVFEAEMIPKAFLVSGVVGIIMTSIYSWLQSRMRFSQFSVLNLFVAVALTVLMRFGFTLTESNWHIFVVFVMMGPVNIIALLGFWGTVGRIFTLRQGKRLFGMIDTGQIIGIILSSYAIPVLLSFQFETRDLLYLSAVSVAVALLVQIFISNRFALGKKVETEQQAVSTDNRFFSLFKNRYIGLMSLFVVLLISVTIIVHYSFLAVTKENYPDPTDLAAFLGYFNGTLMIFSILIKTFVYGRLMKTWGLKVALAISPVLILIFTIIAAVIGGVFGYSALAASFTLFFLVISVSKLFTKSLQDSIVAPSMKILYQSLDINIRYNVQARVDGTINEIAVLLSSLVLAGLGAVSIFGLIHITYFLIVVLIAWGFISFRLYNAYRNSLDQSLAMFQQSQDTPGQVKLRDILEGALARDSEPVVHNALSFIERIDFSGFMNALSNLLGRSSQRIRNISLRKISEQKIPVTGLELLNRIKGERAQENKVIADQILSRVSPAGKSRISKDEMLRIAKSASVQDRLAAGMLLFESDKFDHHAVLNNLLRDPDHGVKNLAIQAAKTWKVVDAVPVLIDFLSTPYYRQTSEALVQIGESTVELLEQSYYKSGIAQQTLNRVTRILGQIGGEAATASLVNKINYQNREIESHALRALKNMNYQANEQVLQGIIVGVRSDVLQIAWYLAALHTTKEHFTGDPLERAIEEELKNAQDHMYLLMSLAYDPKSIYHIRENLESGTSEGIGFAIELLDIFVAEEIKPVLFPVLDDTSTVEKIRQLQVEFPIEILEPYELLLGIINRDPNFANPVTKACAINALSLLEQSSLTYDLIAQIFNPDDLLSELAVVQTAKLDPGVLETVLDRLPAEKKNHLQKAIRAAGEGQADLVWNRIEFVKQIPWFADISSLLHYRIAGHTERSILNEGEAIRVSAEAEGTGLAMMHSGDVSLTLNERELGRLAAFGMSGILPFMVDQKDLLQVKAHSDSILYTMTQSSVDELIFDHEEIALAMYRWAGDQRNQAGALTMEMVS